MDIIMPCEASSGRVRWPAACQRIAEIARGEGRERGRIAQLGGKGKAAMSKSGPGARRWVPKCSRLLQTWICASLVEGRRGAGKVEGGGAADGCELQSRGATTALSLRSPTMSWSR